MSNKTKIATLLIILWLLVIAGCISDYIEPTTVVKVPAEPIAPTKVNDSVQQIVPTQSPEPTPAPDTPGSMPVMSEPENHVTANPDASEVYYESTDTIAMMAITMRNESIGSIPEESMKVGWCICNRAMNWGQSISHVISSPNQFAYYGGGLYSGYWYELATYVIIDYYHELNGEPYEYYGRLLPSDMMWFKGDGSYNTFYNYYPY